MIIKSDDIINLAKKFMKEECCNNVINEQNLTNSEKVTILTEITNQEITNEQLEEYISYAYLFTESIGVYNDQNINKIQNVIHVLTAKIKRIKQDLIKAINAFYLSNDPQSNYRNLQKIETSEEDLYNVYNEYDKLVNYYDWFDLSRYIDGKNDKGIINRVTKGEDVALKTNKSITTKLNIIKKEVDSIIILVDDFKNININSSDKFNVNDVVNLLNAFNGIVISMLSLFLSVYKYNEYLKSVHGVSNIVVYPETKELIKQIYTNINFIKEQNKEIKNKLMNDIASIKMVISKQTETEPVAIKAEEETDEIDQYANQLKDQAKNAVEVSLMNTIMYWLNPMTYWNLLTSFVSTKTILLTGGIGAVVIGVGIAAWYLYKYLFNKDCSKLAGQKRIDCLLKVADKAIDKADQDKSKCENTEDPARCKKEIDELIKKWKIRKEQIKSGKEV
jgi:hypothetical protein